MGPVVQFGSERTKAGVQGLCWVNYILGVYFRIRYISGDDTFHCVGLYAKVPFATTGFEEENPAGVTGTIGMINYLIAFREQWLTCCFIGACFCDH